MAKEAKRLTVSDPGYAPADYFEVVFLKQAEFNGVWLPAALQFPTEAEATAHADILREGRHGSIKVMPRNWA